MDESCQKGFEGNFQLLQNKASKNVANKIINSIFATTAILKTQNIGTKEELLEHLNQDHRYLIDGNYKIIYFIENNTIYITHVFDTRQNPVKLK